MKKDSRTKKTLINLLTGFGGQLVNIVLQFITRTVFISVLGKSYLGINGLFSDILSMLSLTELGIDTALNFQLYKPLAEHNNKRIRILMKFYKRAYVTIGVVIVILGVCIVPFLPVLIKDYESLEVLKINAVIVYLIYLLRSASSYMFFAYKSVIIRADQKLYVTNLADYAIAVLECIAQVVILKVTKDFMIFTAITVLFIISKNFVNAMIAKKMYPEAFVKEPESLSREEVKGLFKDCGALFIYKVNNVVLKATDNIVLSSFIGLGIVGMYSNYLMIHNAIKSILSRFFTATRASLGNLYAVSDIDKKYSVFEVMNYLTFVLYGTACVGIAIVANEFLECWANKGYIIPQPFPILIGIELLLSGLNNCLGQVRNISGAFRQMWYRPIIGIFINIVVSIVLVKPFGINGVILGTICSMLLSNFLVDPSIIYKVSFEKIKKPSVYYRECGQYIVLLCVIAIFDGWFCQNVLVGHGWISMIFHALVCVASVPLVFFIIYRKTPKCQYVVEMGANIFRQLKRKIAK